MIITNTCVITNIKYYLIREYNICIHSSYFDTNDKTDKTFYDVSQIVSFLSKFVTEAMIIISRYQSHSSFHQF